MNATHPTWDGARVRPAPDILNSWKEIASYMGRGIRTVQRWEYLGLPVRRPHAHARSAVVAMRSELDSWICSCPLTKPANVDENLSATQQLILESRRIRAEVRDTRKALRNAVTSLTETLKLKLYDKDCGKRENVSKTAKNSLN